MAGQGQLAAGICLRLKGANAMRFLKHLGRLLKEFGAFAWHNKAWWILPVVLVFLLLGLFIVTGQTVAPFIYTLF